MKSLYIYIGVTIFIGLFGAVYEIFSHNVFSPAMYLAWLIPCCFGVGAYIALAFTPIKKVPGTLTECVYNFGVAMLTVRSIFIGVIEIYGTTNKIMVNVYTIVSLVFIIAGGLAFWGIFIYALIDSRRQNNRQGA